MLLWRNGWVLAASAQPIRRNILLVHSIDLLFSINSEDSANNYDDSGYESALEELPPDTTHAATNKAIMDEISHAKAAFAITEGFLNRSVSPGDFQMKCEF